MSSAAKYQEGREIKFVTIEEIDNPGSVEMLIICDSKLVPSLGLFTNLKILCMNALYNDIYLPYLPKLEHLFLRHVTKFTMSDQYVSIDKVFIDEMILSDNIDFGAISINELTMGRCCGTFTVTSPLKINALYISDCHPISFDLKEDVHVNELVSKNSSSLSDPSLVHLCVTKLAVDTLDFSTLSINISKLEEVKVAISMYDKGEIDYKMEALRGVKRLNLSHTGINTIKFLKKFTSLEILDISATPVSDLSPLAGLKNLRVLTSNSITARDFSPLKTLIKLESLSLVGNHIKDIEFVKDMKDLKYLYLSDNKIVVVDPLASCPMITKAWLSRNLIFDVRALQACSHLLSLELDGNYIMEGNPYNKNVMSLEGTRKERASIYDNMADVTNTYTYNACNKVYNKIVASQVPSYIDIKKLPNVGKFMRAPTNAHPVTRLIYILDLIGRACTMINSHEHADDLYALYNEELDNQCVDAIRGKTIAFIATFFEGYSIDENPAITVCDIVIKALESDADNKIDYARSLLDGHLECIKYMC